MALIRWVRPVYDLGEGRTFLDEIDCPVRAETFLVVRVAGAFTVANRRRDRISKLPIMPPIVNRCRAVADRDR